jgi:hypothetical protein
VEDARESASVRADGAERGGASTSMDQDAAAPRRALLAWTRENAPARAGTASEVAQPRDGDRDRGADQARAAASDPTRGAHSPATDEPEDDPRRRSRVAERVSPPELAAAVAQRRHEVRVEIEAIEVVDATRRPAQRAASSAAPVSLADYLRGRGGRT